MIHSRIYCEIKYKIIKNAYHACCSSFKRKHYWELIISQIIQRT